MLKLLTLILLFTGVTSCSEIPDIQQNMNLEEIAIEINAEVGNANAEELSQCKILPIGAKPCGGPWGYLVYSTQESDTDRLKTLIERYDELDEIRNEEEGRSSTCDVSSPPELELHNGQCHGNGGYAWNPGFILEINGIEE